MKKYNCSEKKAGFFKNVARNAQQFSCRHLGVLFLGVLFSAAVLSGCGIHRKSSDPIALTLWHVYGAQTDSPLNDMIDRFNQTRGQELGISVQVTSVSNTNSIHEAILAAANHEPGAAQLPDLFVAYPKVVLSMPDPDILVDYRDYFTSEELKDFIPAFLEEGVIHDHLNVFPVAKSTEILFVNKTLFDRFAQATGASMEEMKTWDGLFHLAEQYAAWTDGETPEIPGDGKCFFVHDYHFNYFQVGVESLGETFFDPASDGGKLAFGPMYHRVWEPYAEACLSGGVWLREGYATEPIRTGDAIASVASSASVLYYENVVTYSNNISEPVEIVAMPVPVFSEGKNLVMQRGSGFCTVKSTPEREKAAVAFLKWLTEPENNVAFTTAAGYMPVTETAFARLPEAVKNLPDPKYRSLYQAFIDTQASYTFYTAPQLGNYLDTEVQFEQDIRREMRDARQKLLEEQETQESSELSGKSDSGKTDSGKSDSGKSDAWKSDSAVSDSIQSDTGKSAGTSTWEMSPAEKEQILEAAGAAEQEFEENFQG